MNNIKGIFLIDQYRNTLTSFMILFNKLNPLKASLIEPSVLALLSSKTMMYFFLYLGGLGQFFSHQF